MGFQPGRVYSTTQSGQSLEARGEANFGRESWNGIEPARQSVLGLGRVWVDQRGESLGLRTDNDDDDYFFHISCDGGLTNVYPADWSGFRRVERLWEIKGHVLDYEFNKKMLLKKTESMPCYPIQASRITHHREF